MRDIISTLLNHLDKNSMCLSVYFLFNRDSKQHNRGDYSSFSSYSEYLSEIQAEEIINALQTSGFNVREFDDEIDFINSAINLSKDELHENLIVLNQIQTGIKVGRKSLIPSFCDMLGILYTGSNPYTVSLCRNKYHCACILNDLAIPNPRSWLYASKDGWINNLSPTEGMKVILKPNLESSSIGIDSSNIGLYGNILENKAFEMTTIFNQDIIVQEFISGYEVEVPIIFNGKPQALKPVGIQLGESKILGHDILTYKIRSIDQYDFYDFYNIDVTTAENIMRIAEQTSSICGITGFGRVDFRISENLEIFVTDISTNPHITQASSFYYAFTSLGFSYSDMIKCLIASAYTK